MPAISEKIVGDLPRPAKGGKLHYFTGAVWRGQKAPSGFAVRVTAAGTKSFVLYYRVRGKGHLETLGRWDPKSGEEALSVYEAIVAAQELVTDLKSGRREPRPVQADNLSKERTVASVLDQFLKRVRLRNGRQAKRIFDRLVKPAIGELPISRDNRIRPQQIVEMMDDIAGRNGPTLANRTLVYLRMAFTWYGLLDNNFQSPVAGITARKKRQNRSRILADDEVRDLLAGLEKVTEPEGYAPYVKSVLLRNIRRSAAREVHSPEPDRDLWIVPGDRYKTKRDHLDQPMNVLSGSRLEDEMTNDGPRQDTKSCRSHSEARRQLDRAIAEIRKREGRPPMAKWTLQDLRQTAKSLACRVRNRELAERLSDQSRARELIEFLDQNLHPFNVVDLDPIESADTGRNA